MPAIKQCVRDVLELPRGVEAALREEVLFCRAVSAIGDSGEGRLPRLPEKVEALEGERKSRFNRS